MTQPSAGGSNPYGVQIWTVRSPSGSDLNLQTSEEADWYESRRDRYLADNMFPNVSDLQDLDRLLLLEVLCYRWGLWMGQGFDYLYARVDEGQLKDNIQKYSVEIRLLKASLGIDKATRDKEKGECHDDRTEVLTQDGWKLFSQVQRGELVATRSSHGVLEYQPVRRLIADDYDGDLFVVETDELNFAVTPNHRMLQRPNRSLSPYTFARMEEVAAETLTRFLPKAAAIEGRPDRMVDFRPVPVDSDGEPTEHRLPRTRRVDFARFLGIWLAAGASRSRTNVHINLPGVPSKVAYLDELLTYMGWSFRRWTTSNGVHWSIHNQELRDRLVPRVPQEAFVSWSRTELLGLLQGFLGEPSTVPMGTPILETLSQGLADDVQRLVAHVGLSAKIETVGAGYGVSLGKSAATLFPDQVKRVPYVGKVYCLTVPNGTLLTRRGGLVLWSGNSLADYTQNLLERAKAFGYHRNEQYALAVTLLWELRSMVKTYDRCDDEERRTLDLSQDSIFQWIRENAIERWDQLVADFRKNQAMWIKSM